MPALKWITNSALLNDLLFFLFLDQFFFMVCTPHSINCVTVTSDIFLHPFLRSCCICIPIRVSFDFRRLFNWFWFLVTYKSTFIYVWLETALFELFLFTLRHSRLVFEVWGFLFPEFKKTLVNRMIDSFRWNLLPDNFWFEWALLHFLDLFYFTFNFKSFFF